MDKTKYIKANSVAFSGHRTIAEDRKDEIRKKLRGKIRLLYAMGITNFYCGMALGFDMLAAEEVHLHGMVAIVIHKTETTLHDEQVFIVVSKYGVAV